MIRRFTLVTRPDLEELKSPIDSPFFTGDPRGPTPATNDADNSLATTAFVDDALTNSNAIKRIRVFAMVFAARHG